jgi:hypothetical protein
MLGLNRGRIESVTVVVLVREFEAPVIVTVKVPTLAAMPAARVSVLVPAVLAGLKEAVTPFGKPEADKLTLALKPPCGFTVIVVVPLPAWKTLRLLGDAENVKVPALFTARETVAVLVKRPEVPVTVTLAVPMAAVLLAVKVTVLVPVVLAGLKDAVTPLGRPDTDKPTVLEKPFCGITVIVLVALPPRVTLTLLDDEESEKPGMRPPVGQLATRLVAFNEPMPVAKSQPVAVP